MYVKLHFNPKETIDLTLHIFYMMYIFVYISNKAPQAFWFFPNLPKKTIFTSTYDKQQGKVSFKLDVSERYECPRREY